MKTRRSDYAWMIALAALLVLLLSAWWMPPADAEEVDQYGSTLTDAPTVAYPLRAVDGSTPHLVVVQAAARTWRARMAARAWDLAVPGLDVRTGPCVPELPCIRVHVGYWSPERALEVSGTVRFWSGLCVCSDPATRDVYLNRARISSREVGRTRVASHEIGHALGLAHHHGTGVMGTREQSWIWRPSDAEADALALYFTGPYA